MTEPNPPHRLGAEEVRRIASLARLAVDDQEARVLGVELSTIVRHIASLSAGPAPDPSAIPLDLSESALRPDVAGSDPLQLPPAALAPVWEDPFFVVPRSAVHDPDPSP